MGIILIYVTFENLESANKMADILMTKHLVACANIFPINSVFWWQSEINHSDEIVAIFKTRAEYWNIVKEIIEKYHDYQIPCIIKLNVETNDEYSNWVLNETKGAILSY